MFDDLFHTKGLSYERLNALVKLSETGSLVKAADNDLGRQSRLSHQIRELSEYFGVELTERKGKNIGLTDAGEALARFAKEHLATLHAFRTKTKQSIHTFKIGAENSLLHRLVIPSLGKTKYTGNQAKFRLKSMSDQAVIERLLERNLEIGIVRSNSLPLPLASETVFEQRYAIFVPQRLVPMRGMLKLRDALLNCPHAFVPGDRHLLNHIEIMAQSLGGAFVPQMECDSIEQCIAAVSTGNYASIMPVQIKQNYDLSYTVVEHEALDALTHSITMAWHPRTFEIIGSQIKKIAQDLCAAMKQEFSCFDYE